MEFGDWKIESDALNVIVSRKARGKNKAGELTESWRAIAYYPNLEGAAGFILQQHIRDSGCKDLKSILQSIDAARNIIKEMVKK